MSDQLKINPEAIAALLGQSQAGTDRSGVSAPSPSAADGLPDPRPSKAIPTPAIADDHQPRDDTHPGWNHCGDAVAGAQRFGTANEWIVSDDPSVISSSFRDHLRAVYPPDLPKDPSWMNQEESEYGRASSNGIDVRPLVNENRKRVRAYLDYAREEQESRQDLFNKLDELEEKMVCVRQVTRDLGPHRSKNQIPPRVLDKISALQLEESELNKEHPKLLKLLWVRRAEVQGTIARILENRTFDFEKKDETNGVEPMTTAYPSCAPKDPDTGGAQSTSEAQSEGKSIPDWFCLLEKKGWVTLRSQGEENRFAELLNKLGRLEDEVRRQEYTCKQEEQAGGQGTRKTPWDDHFHEPNPGWAHESQRIRGGWWTCRDGEDAPLAERLCQICRSESPESSTCGSPVAKTPYRRTPKSPPPARIPQRKQRQRHDSKVLAADYLEELMGHVRTAMAIVAEKDKKFVTATMQLERLDASHQLRGDERGRFPAPRE
ncbi:hypothetical protein RB595_005502 [Gaeumannomyces hyphopodioides]